MTGPARRRRWVSLPAAAWLAVAPGAPAIAHDTGTAHREAKIAPAFDYDPPAPGAYALADIAPSPPASVLDSQGRRHPLARFTSGRITLLSFIYTRCSDYLGCPLASAVLGEVAESLRREPRLAAQVAPHVRLVSLSFDPAHDTPAVMAAYSQRDALSADAGQAAEWFFLTTASATELKPVLEGYDQYVVPEVDEEGKVTGAYAHVLKVFLLDRRGHVRNIYGVAYLDPRLLLADIETLLIEEKRSRP